MITNSTIVYGFNPAAALAAIEDSQQEIIGRNVETVTLAVGLLAGQNVAFVGPPGTAKTHLGITFGSAAVGAEKTGVWQVHPQTTVSELVGEIDMNGVIRDEDRVWQQRLAGSLVDPRVLLAIIDEVFKASNATLSGLLRLLQDGIIRGEDGREYTTNALSFVGLSNEFPAGTCGQRKRVGDIDMAALWDRFHLRRWVSPLRGGDVTEMLLAVQQGAARRAAAGETGRGQRPDVTTVENAESYWQGGQRAVLESFANVPSATLDRLSQWADSLCDRDVYVSNRTVPVMLQAACAHGVLHGRSVPNSTDLRWASVAVAYEGPESLSEILDSNVMDYLSPKVDQTVQACASEMAKILAAATVAARDGGATLDDLAEIMRRLAACTAHVKHAISNPDPDSDGNENDDVYEAATADARRAREILNPAIVSHFDTMQEAAAFVARAARGE